MAAALRRLFHGPEVERVRPEPEPPPPPPTPPPPLWGPECRRCCQHRCVREKTSRPVSQEQPPYPGYGSQYWNSSPRPPYSSPYPVGPDIQGQGIDPSYTNGVYGNSYSAAGTRPPYPNLPQSNMYYSSGHAPYSTESPNAYRSPSPASNWNYPPVDCPAEGCMVRRQVPGYSPQQESYNQPEQGANQRCCYPEASHLPSGTMNDYKPVRLDPKSSASNSKVQYSAQPQLYYDNVHRKHSAIDHGQGSTTSIPPPLETSSVEPGIQKVLQVMEGVEQLEEEVDEFVGKKTDKDYWLLEETLTKKLLDLDSIETGGQDNVRQARKEAVHRIQATLEELERKGL